MSELTHELDLVVLSLLIANSFRDFTTRSVERMKTYTVF